MVALALGQSNQGPMVRRTAAAPASQVRVMTFSSRVLSRPGKDPTNDLSRPVRRQRPGCGGGRRRRLCRDASKTPRSIHHVPVNCTYESYTYCA
jgi:hypothetical protein